MLHNQLFSMFSVVRIDLVEVEAVIGILLKKSP